ncbi:MAG: hypothetical protein HW379_878 [Actinobacteria bacterium]|nr:hypothetical protein [Actinomycetota bacterium]
MAEKSSFLNWVGFKGEEPNQPSSVDRIRELESQLADLRSRRDINSLSKEEFEILATETAMAMIKSAQARESKAQSTASRLVAETTRITKEEIEAADSKARSILSSAESRGRKYITTAEEEAGHMVAEAEVEATALVEAKKREVAALASAARREGERIISDATHEVSNYRQWLIGVMAEAERLYKVQTASLDAAQGAIHQSRARLETAFERLADLHKSVMENLNPDNTIINSGPIKVSSERTKTAISAPKKTAKKSVAKKSAARK